VELPLGEFACEWFDPRTGNSVRRARLNQTSGTANLAVPGFEEDIVLLLRKR
jgi:hypothetical protein